MSETPVTYSSADGIARITLAEPDRGNPLNAASVEGMLDGIRRAGADGARVIVLASSGRFFSVGGDIGGFAGAADVGTFIDDLAEGLHRVVSELIRNPAIVVSVVQGTAAGAGFPLAAAADIVIAARSAKFTLGYTKIGLSVDGGTSMLAHTLGLHRLLRLALLNDVLSAADLHEAGVVARVAEDDELSETAESVIAQLAAGSATAQAATKRLLRDAVESAPEALLRAETLSIRARAAEPDGIEGVRAFTEKRPASFNS